MLGCFHSFALSDILIDRGNMPTTRLTDLENIDVVPDIQRVRRQFVTFSHAGFRYATEYFKPVLLEIRAELARRLADEFGSGHTNGCRICVQTFSVVVDDEDTVEHILKNR